MTRRALTFGSVAAAYERFRPGYPEQVVDDVVAYAGHPIRTALEIGAGTGKATRVFAAKGIAVTATEPDAAMIEQLRRDVPPGVTIVRAGLEELEPTRTYDLVYAAASLHWTDPEQRWMRIAALLNPDGVFACLGGPPRLDPELDAAVRAARTPWLADDDVPLPDGTSDRDGLQWPGPELERARLFTDVRRLSVERRMTQSADDYVGQLSTVSAYLELSEDDRRDVLEAIRAVLPPTVDVVADLDLHVARRSAHSSDQA